MSKLNNKGIGHHLLLLVVAVVAVAGAAGYFVWSRQRNSGIDAKAAGCGERLNKGANNGCVKYVQKFLNSINGAGLTVDGIFGGKTESAVKDYQKKYKLTVDGIVGPAETWPSFCKESEKILDKDKEMRNVYSLVCAPLSFSFAEYSKKVWNMDSSLACKLSDKKMRFTVVNDSIPKTWHWYVGFVDNVEKGTKDATTINGVASFKSNDVEKSNLFDVVLNNKSYVRNVDITGKYVNSSLSANLSIRRDRTYIPVSKIPDCLYKYSSTLN